LRTTSSAAGAIAALLIELGYGSGANQDRG
jgi:hypothetical protein